MHHYPIKVSSSGMVPLMMLMILLVEGIGLIQ